MNPFFKAAGAPPAKKKSIPGGVRALFRKLDFLHPANDLFAFSDRPHNPDKLLSRIERHDALRGNVQEQLTFERIAFAQRLREKFF